MTLCIYSRGEPVKKKKKLDPAILRSRDERKKRKIEKKIRSLKKFADHMKPIYEIDTLTNLLKNEYVDVQQ